MTEIPDPRPAPPAPPAPQQGMGKFWGCLATILTPLAILYTAYICRLPTAEKGKTMGGDLQKAERVLDDLVYLLEDKVFQYDVPGLGHEQKYSVTSLDVTTLPDGHKLKTVASLPTIIPILRTGIGGAKDNVIELNLLELLALGHIVNVDSSATYANALTATERYFFSYAPQGDDPPSAWVAIGYLAEYQGRVMDSLRATCAALDIDISKLNKPSLPSSALGALPAESPAASPTKIISESF
ncbi:hypothetical protein J4457_03795 [Candidatus Woesearchaeota archaeon]|nr:hypothetical protein [Candidatus Woesearchaeota archaeon]